MYRNGEELLRTAEEKGVRLSQVVLESEVALTSMPEMQVRDEFWKRYGVMKQSAEKALTASCKTAGGLIEGVAMTQNAYAQKGTALCGSALNRIMAMAFSCSEVNASMGRICAAPTAGSCGILPAVLIGMEEQLDAPKWEMVDALLTATGVGAIYTKNATVAGAEGGCQAECGVASSMAAAAACQLGGGTPAQCMDAASFAMINVMGLVCDPVAGLVQFPCAQRNASGAINALVAADMALAGQKCLIPFDQVVDAMYRVGRSLPYQLRETALGGVAATPAGKELAEKIFG